jgi:CHAT domain-containing protein
LLDEAWCSRVLTRSDRLEDGGDHEAAISHLTEALVAAAQASPVIRARILPPMMVLGTCWSNQVRMVVGQEPLGLPTACLLGGAHLVVGALFAVGSRTTSEVLAGFYERLASGQHVSGALCGAQLAVLQRRRPDTVDWAGLVAIGRDLRLVDDGIAAAVQ